MRFKVDDETRRHDEQNRGESHGAEPRGAHPARPAALHRAENKRGADSEQEADALLQEKTDNAAHEAD